MNFREERTWLILIAAACFLAYANSLAGDFVYDDLRQILRNSLIQDNSLMWRALTSDVWAFKGDGSVAASNYWRPTFTLWHIINFRLFGAAPFGWHITNVLLHTGVCLIAYALLRRWAFSVFVSLSIVLIFAVHPVHVESVAWISGSTDLLFSIFFLGSLWFAQDHKETSKIGSLVFACALYAAAIGAKEVALVCLPIYYLILKPDTEDQGQPDVDLKRPLIILTAIAAAYFFLRWKVLGAISHPVEDTVSLPTALLSVPEMFVFYLRQIFFPYWLSANYPIERVTEIGLTNFIIPLIVALAVLAAIFFIARKSRRSAIASALFLLPLAPAMYAVSYIPDQIVHDRYLYLPLLGMLMLTVPPAAKYAGEKNLVSCAVLLSLLLAAQTFRYNRAWHDELSLWAWSVQIDDSSSTLLQYATAMESVGRYNDAISIYSAAVKKKPGQRVFLGRGRAYLRTGQFQNAESDLLKATEFPLERAEAYALYQAHQALGIAYSQQGNFDAAAKNFIEARRKLPIYAAAITCDLAIVLFQSGQKDAALHELESVRTQARKELLPESKDVFLRLGMLYADQGRKNEARTAITEYLSFVPASGDPTITSQRAQARKLLESLK